jgi:hypothetical protein
VLAIPFNDDNGDTEVFDRQDTVQHVKKEIEVSDDKNDRNWHQGIFWCKMAFERALLVLKNSLMLILLERS